MRQISITHNSCSQFAYRCSLFISCLHWAYQYFDRFRIVFEYDSVMLKLRDAHWCHHLAIWHGSTIANPFTIDAWKNILQSMLDLAWVKKVSLPFNISMSKANVSPFLNCVLLWFMKIWNKRFQNFTHHNKNNVRFITVSVDLRVSCISAI